MEIICLGGLLIFGILISLDVALAMLVASFGLLLWDGTVPIHLVSEKALTQVSLFPLLAIPGFIIAGELMNVVGMTQSLGNLAQHLVGRWRGGMGLATVVACMFFGGMTGSGLAETVAIGSLMIPLLAAHGYPKSFSAAIVASGGSLGPIIPPSIPMVIYASIAPTVSITALFIAGIFPGLLIGLGFMAVVTWRVRRLDLVDVDSSDIKVPFWTPKVLVSALPALAVPIIIFFFIFSGKATVTEASVLATFYVAGYGFIFGKLSSTDLLNAGKSTLISCGIFGFIIAAAGPFSFLMALFQAPGLIADFLLGAAGGSPQVLMLLVTAVLIGLGLLVEATSLVIILAPILAATATAGHINQLHMAVISIVALMLGLFTPPVGTNLFAVVGISGEKIEDISRELLPFLYVSAAIVLCLALFPEITTFLPKVFAK